jgi:hypothetical protein
MERLMLIRLYLNLILSMLAALQAPVIMINPESRHGPGLRPPSDHEVNPCGVKPGVAPEGGHCASSRLEPGHAA